MPVIPGHKRKQFQIGPETGRRSGMSLEQKYEYLLSQEGLERTGRKNRLADSQSDTDRKSTIPVVRDSGKRQRQTDRDKQRSMTERENV